MSKGPWTRFYRFGSLSIFLLFTLSFVLSSLPVFGEGVYCPGTWYDADKFSDGDTGRTKNYWSALGRTNDGTWFVSQEWYPALDWKNPDGTSNWSAYDYQSCDTNRNYAVDPDEMWDKFVWIDSGIFAGHYMCDLNRNGLFDSSDPILPGNVVIGSTNYFYLDGNQNRIEDSWENWNVVQVHDDGSCWMATASNLMQYIDGNSRYYQSAYVQGVEFPDPNPGSDDKHYWTDGGWPHHMLDTWGFSPANHDTGTSMDDYWPENPIPGIKSLIELGLPVGLGVYWASEGGHAFTVYGINTETSTLIIADSDSDRNGTQFYEIGYQWSPTGSGEGILRIDWNNDGTFPDDIVVDYTSFEHSVTSPSGGDKDWFNAFNMYGPTHTMVVGYGEDYAQTTVHLRPFDNGTSEQTDAVAGRVIVNNYGTLRAETGTTFNISSMAIREHGRFVLDGSEADVYHETVCDGAMDILAGNGNFHYLSVGTSTPGQVQQTGGTMNVGMLRLGFDTLQQGDLTITPGNFTSDPNGVYNLVNGNLNANVEYIGAKGKGTFNQSGGTNTIGNLFTIGLAQGATGTYNLTGGHLVTTSTVNPAEMTVGNYGNGTLNLSGSSLLDCQGTFYAGKQLTSNNNYITMSGFATFLARGDEILGDLGSVDFTQNTLAGVGHQILGTLYMAVNESSDAEYTLTNGLLSANAEFIGVAGTAWFTQSGGIHHATDVTLAEQAGSSARYLLLAGTLQTTGDLCLGKAGTATFVQSGSSVTVGGSMTMAQSYGLESAYGLSNDGTLTVHGDETIGYSGQATFTHISGTHSVAGTLMLGRDIFSQGGYHLQNGNLSSNSTVIGQNNIGEFTQDNGDHNVATELCLGKAIFAAGTYILNDGTLTTHQTVVGDRGSGTFTQNGGTHQIATNLYLGRGTSNDAIYTLNAGTLIADRLAPVSKDAQFQANGGTLRVNEANLTNQPSEAYVFSRLHIGHAGGTSDGRVVFNGHTDLTANELILGCDSDKFATLEMSDATNLFGTINARNFYLGYAERSRGTFTIDQAHTITSDFQYVGYFGDGSITQSTGTNQVETLYLGFWPSGDGQYTLTGGSVTSNEQIIGMGGEGAFSHDGGTNTIASTLFIAYGTGADGTYTLNNGNLTVPTIDISRNGAIGRFNLSETGTLDTQHVLLRQNAWFTSAKDLFWNGDFDVLGGNLTLNNNNTLVLCGNGRLDLTSGYVLADHLVVGTNDPYNQTAGIASFNHTAGVTHVTHDLTIGSHAGCQGNYSLTGLTSRLTAERVIVGGSSAGNMMHQSGSVTASQSVAVGVYQGSTGTYQFSGGSLTTPRIEIGGQGPGLFNWTGGTLKTGVITVGTGGTMNLNNSESEWIFNGSLTMAGGTLNTNDKRLTLGGGTDGSFSSLTVSGGTMGRIWHLKVADTASASVSHTGGIITAHQVSLGWSHDRTGTYEISGTALLDASSLYLGMNGYGNMIQRDSSTVTVGSLQIGSNASSEGHYTLTGNAHLSVEGPADIGSVGGGTFTQPGGTHMVTGNLTIAESGPSLSQPDTTGWGTYSLGGGSLVLQRSSSARTVYVGYRGRGTLSMGDASGTGTISEVGTGKGTNLVVKNYDHSSTSGVVRGWGSVGLTGTLTNNGKIIADGFGTDRDLDMSSFTKISNSLENTTTNGWFAQNHGRLILPKITVPTGDSIRNWGESPFGTTSGTDATPDLVNSLQLAFTNVRQAGDLSISLLAADRSDIPPGLPGSAIGIWDFIPSRGFLFDQVGLSFRYDDALAQVMNIIESDLRVYHYVGSTWMDVTSGINLTTHWITAERITDFSMFAVAQVPEPTTLALLTLATATLLRRTRREHK